MKIVIEVTGKDADAIDAESLAEMVYDRLAGYEVTVTGYEEED